MSEKESILIVDDDEGTCKSLSLIFGKNNYTIDTASTGQEALEKAYGKFYNVVLMDIKLPDMEGIELLSALKEIHSDLDVLIITAYASMETAKRAVNEGASGYITKPINVNEVLTTLKKTIEKQRSIIDQVQQYKLSQEAVSKLEIKIKSLEYSSSLSDLFIRISSNIVAACSDQNLLGDAITDALKETGDFFNADYSDIFQFSKNGKCFKKTYEWLKEGMLSSKNGPEEIYPESFPWLSPLLTKLQHVHIPVVNDLPSVASAEKKYFDSDNIQSLLIIPLTNYNVLSGFWGIYTITGKKMWMEDEIALLHVISDILARAMSHTGEKIRIAVGEEKTLLRNGICTAIVNAGMELIGESYDSETLIEIVIQYQPDLIIINANLPGSDEQTLIKHIKEILPLSNILVICPEQNISGCFLSAIQAGANGSLPESSSSDQLINAIKAIHVGQAVTTIACARKLEKERTYLEQKYTANDILNKGEIEILTLASKGMSNKAIGEHISLSERTIDSRFRSIFKKTGTNSRTEAIYKALKNDWITLS